MDTNKTYILIGLTALLVVVTGGYIIFTNQNAETVVGLDETPVVTSDSEAKEFAQDIWDLASSDGILPIEGYDAFLLLGKISGLEKEDFIGVKSFEGVYSIENDELVYTRTAGQPVTSAEQTVSTEGYQVLLDNLKARLNVDSADEVLQALK